MMSTLARKDPSYAQQRRTVAVGRRGVQLGLDLVPGVVLADVQSSGDPSARWMPAGQVVARVWCADPAKAWAGVLAAQRVEWTQIAGLQVVMVAKRPNRWPWSWARWRAWWRWQVRPRAGR